MKYRILGNTGTKISEIAFGGGAVGGLLINKDDETRIKALQFAMDAGINWIDTAASYGQGKSEEAIGRLLKEVDGVPHISTKFSIDTRNLSDIRGQIERSLYKSLDRLETDSVLLFQLHNTIGPESAARQLGIEDILRSNGVFDVLDDLRRQGLIDHFGITALGDTNSIKQVIESGRPSTAQVYYNILNPSAGLTPPPQWSCYNFGGIMECCREHNVGILNIRVFSAGVLATDDRTGRERPLTEGDSVESEAEKAGKIFAELGDEFGTRAQTALRFALAQQKTSSVVIGIAEQAYLQEAIEAEEMGGLPQEAMDRIEAVYERGSN